MSAGSETLDLQPGPAPAQLDLQPGPAPAELDLQPGPADQDKEPGGTLSKAQMSAAGAAAEAVAGVGTGLKTLSDIGPAKPSFARHEAAAIRAGEEQIPYNQAMGELLDLRGERRQQLMMPGAAIEQTAGEAAQQAKEAAAAMEGNKTVAKAAELVGGMVPYLITGPAAPAVAGLSAYGRTYNQALDYYRKQGLSEEEANGKAQNVAASTGLATGEIFTALPGFGKAAAEKLLARQLQAASPIVRAAVGTAAASAQGSLVMGADTLVRQAQARWSYRPELSWGQVLEESAKDALAGGVGTALIHAPMEAVRAVGSAKFGVRTGGTEGTQGTQEGGVSEFGGESDLPPPSSQPGVEKAVPGASGSEISQPTVPESPQTLESQVQWLEQGKRQAVLVTPGSPMVRVPEGMETHETEAGTFIYDPDQLKPAELDKAVKDNTVGELLGYGTAAKPEPGTEAGVVVVRGSDGQEKQSVVTNGEDLGKVIAAARATAGPGDTVGLESGAEVLDERKANAIATGNIETGVQPQRGGGDEGGQAAEAGGGDRLRGEGPSRAGQEEAQEEGQILVGGGQAEAGSGGRPGLISGTKAEAWADEVLRGGGVHAGPDVIAAYVVKGAAVLERLAVKSFDAFQDAFLKLYPEAKDHVRYIYDNAKYKLWLAERRSEAAEQQELKARATGLKIQASAAISDPVKAAITEYLYRPRTIAGDDALAAGIIREFGLDAAEEAVRNPPESLPGPVQRRLLGLVTTAFAEQERQARLAGDEPAAKAVATRQARLWQEMMPRFTEMAQTQAAMDGLVEMSPDAQVEKARMEIEKGNREVLGRKAPELEQMRAALDQGRREGLEAVRQDPNVNGAARGAVDAAIAGSEETKRAVVMDLAGPWADSPEIVNLTRDFVRARAEQMLGERPPARGVPAGQQLRAIMGDLAKRAASIFAGHLQGAEPAMPIVDKLMQRLGITRDRATGLANALNKEWEQQLAAARNRLPKRLANQRAARERAEGLSLNSPTPATDAAIRRQLSQLNLKLGNVLRQEAGRQEGTGEHVAERVVQASGLTGEAADTLRNVLKNRWNALVTDAQRRTLERMEASSGVKTSRPLRSAFDKLMEMERLGALTGDRFLEVVKGKLKLKQLTQEDAGILRSLVRRAQEKPEGFLRQQAAADVLKFTEKLKGAVSWKDVPMAIFYANVLSGLTTPAKIMFENENLLVGSTLASFLSRPRNLLHPAEWLTSTVDAYRRGLVKGALQAASTLKTGTVTGVWAEPRTNVLEMKPFGERMDVVNFWKYFGRMIGTAHELTFKPAWEVKQTELAREIAAREGLSGQALWQRVANLLADTEGEWAKARGQAMAELQGLGDASKVDLARRTREILEQRREEQMPGSTETARDYALRTAYLNEPYGFLGGVATTIRSGLEKLRRAFPVWGTAAKTQIPFTTVVANVLNERLNWTPWGLVRALDSYRTDKLYGRAIMSSSERAELYAKAVLGTIVMGAMWELFGSHIHGNGPSDPAKRRQLQAAGWIPHSIQIGNRFYSYMNTPFGLGLAVIGNFKDWERYGKGEQADAATRAAFAVKATANAIVSQGNLDSVKRIFEVMGSESTKEGADKLEKMVARTATSFVVPNLVQQVDRIFDPTVYDKTGTEALIRGQIPFVRREGKPALTVLGDPIEADPFHYWTSTLTKDTLMQTLAEKQAWVPEPSRQQIIGEKQRGQDYYRAMTPDEYYDWIQESGKAIRERLEMNLDRIATAEPEEAKAFVERVAREQRAKTKPKF